MSVFMRQRWLRLSASLFAVGAAAVGCRQSPHDQAIGRAREAAAGAATPDQERLWREAADQGLVVGLDRVSTAERAVAARRQQSAATSPPRGGPPATQAPSLVIPPDVEGHLRVVSAPRLSRNAFSGMAKVDAPPGDRIVLNIGGSEPLVLLARAGQKPIAVGQNELVQLTYLPSTDGGAPDEEIVLRTAAGSGIGRVIKSGPGPITLNERLFGVFATQEKAPNAQTVWVRVGDTSLQTVRVGQIVQFGNVSVLLVGNDAPIRGRASPEGGPPYLIHLLVWSP
jgi:hypothetical protein